MPDEITTLLLQKLVREVGNSPEKMAAGIRSFSYDNSQKDVNAGTQTYTQAKE